MPKNFLVRLISSSDHAISQDELIEIIKNTGTDRYDTQRLQQFNDFYANHNVDFFAESTDKEHIELKIKQMAAEFPDKTRSDRQMALRPDIAIVYDAAKCRMIKDVYESQSHSDCYQFITKPIDALIEVRSLV